MDGFVIVVVVTILYCTLLCILGCLVVVYVIWPYTYATCLYISIILIPIVIHIAILFIVINQRHILGSLIYPTDIMLLLLLLYQIAVLIDLISHIIMITLLNKLTQVLNALTTLPFLSLIPPNPTPRHPHPTEHPTTTGHTTCPVL